MLIVICLLGAELPAPSAACQSVLTGLDGSNYNIEHLAGDEMMTAEPSMLDELETRWIATLARYDVKPGRAGPAFDALRTAYGQPHRHYHTLAHIRQMFAVLDDQLAQAGDPGALELAVWLHDLVYDPLRQDNEQRSAALGAALLHDLDVDETTIAHVQALVLATADHQPGDDPDAAVLIDADLAILGSAPSQYRSYCQAIRREYAHLPDAAYRQGRAEVLRSFLKRPALYLTDLMRSRYERQAWQNLAAELAELQTFLGA